VPRPRRALGRRQGVRPGAQGLPPRRRRERSEPVVTPQLGSVRATAADLHEHPQPLPAATPMALLTRQLAGSGEVRAAFRNRSAGHLRPGPGRSRYRPCERLGGRPDRGRPGDRLARVTVAARTLRPLRRQRPEHRLQRQAVRELRQVQGHRAPSAPRIEVRPTVSGRSREHHHHHSPRRRVRGHRDRRRRGTPASD